MCVCLSVCSFAYLKNHLSRLFVQARAVSRSFSDDYDVRYAHRDAIWDVDVWAKEPCIRWDPNPRREWKLLGVITCPNLPRWIFSTAFARGSGAAIGYQYRSNMLLFYKAGRWTPKFISLHVCLSRSIKYSGALHVQHCRVSNTPGSPENPGILLEIFKSLLKIAWKCSTICR